MQRFNFVVYKDGQEEPVLEKCFELENVPNEVPAWALYLIVLGALTRAGIEVKL